MPIQKDQITDVKGNRPVKPNYVRQHSLQYKTFLKRALVEALLNAFKEYPDADIAKSKVGIEYRTDRADFPQVLIKFYEKSIENAGVGHTEWLPSPEDPNYPDGPTFTKFIQYGHRLYTGDIEFEIWAQSSVDRDKITDVIMEVLAMSEVSSSGLNFRARLYESINETQPYSQWHFIALNTDKISGYGEQTEQVPWLAEDMQIFKTAYRIPLFGEFYSLTPKNPPSGGTGFIEEIDVYPWDEADPLDIPPEDFPEEIIPEGDYIKFKHHKKEPFVPVPVEHGLETSLTLETSETLETRE